MESSVRLSRIRMGNRGKLTNYWPYSFGLPFPRNLPWPMTLGFPGNNTETRGLELGVATTMTARQLTIGTYSGPAMGSWLLGRISFLTSMFYRVAMTDTGYVSTKKEQAHMIERRTCGAYLCLPTRELRRHP